MGERESDTRMQAGRIAGRSEVREVRLFASEVQTLRLPAPGSGLRYELAVQPNGKLDDEADILIVEATYEARFFDAEPPTGDADEHAGSFAVISCTFAGLYEVDSEGMEFSEDEVKAFAETTGAFALYPYAREFVQSMTARMGLPSLTLGLYKIPGPADEDD